MASSHYWKGLQLCTFKAVRGVLAYPAFIIAFVYIIHSLTTSLSHQAFPCTELTTVEHSEDEFFS